MSRWMFRIARNLHLNRIRARKVRGEEPLDEERTMGGHVVNGVRVMESRLTYAAVRQCVAHRARASSRCLAHNGCSFSSLTSTSAPKGD